MNEPLEIPEALRLTWNRLLNRMPIKLRQKEDVLESVLLFLKLGGERLAKQAIEAARASLTLEGTRLRRQQKAEAMRRAAERLEAENNANSEDENESEEDNPDEDVLL